MAEGRGAAGLMPRMATTAAAEFLSCCEPVNAHCQRLLQSKAALKGQLCGKSAPA